MANPNLEQLSGLLLDHAQTLSLAELCRCCAIPAEQVLIMVEQGIIEPQETRITTSRWVFASPQILRLKAAIRLQHDLGINIAGAALALDLLDEVKQLRQQLKACQRRLDTIEAHE